VARNLPRPVVGYFGSIHEWIDVELIAWLARSRPEWSFLLVGYAAIKVAELSALPNVVLAGAQPYASLPAWAKAFDVAIIPYRRNRQVENANPLKLREYLATGKPIVAVGNPEIARFASVVRIAEGRADFLAKLEQAIADGPEQGAAERMAAVAEQTWDRRVEEVLREVAASIAATDMTFADRRVSG
jgi:glycosyltransferase involved in cell wall biosynthesis